MKCPICGKLLPPNSDRCPDCGGEVKPAKEEAYFFKMSKYAPRLITYYTPPNQTKRSKGCCCALIILVPLLLGLIAAIIGVTSFVLADFDYEEFSDEFFEDTPFEDRLPVEPPAEADESCFTIRSGAVTFHPDRWDGGRVLRIPETVDGEPLPFGVGNTYIAVAPLESPVVYGTVETE